jgi:hypothetical protein
MLDSLANTGLALLGVVLKIAAIGIEFFLALLLFVVALSWLFPRQFKTYLVWFDNWLHRHRLKKSFNRWFVIGGGHGSSYWYFERGQSAPFYLYLGRPTPAGSVNFFVWNESKMPLTPEEVHLMETRIVDQFAKTIREDQQ